MMALMGDFIPGTSKAWAFLEQKTPLNVSSFLQVLVQPVPGAVTTETNYSVCRYVA